VEISDGAGQIAKGGVRFRYRPAKNVLYDAPTANGPIPVLETYSDYRDVNGLKLPSKVVITLSGKRVSGFDRQEHPAQHRAENSRLGKAAMKPSAIWKPGAFVVLACCALGPARAAEPPAERGKRIVYEALQALGGDRFPAYERPD
jgi:hypothetical protein